ncbi:MAG: hypothetical protein HY834_01335 [Devosia nanyangense]|uniref:Uncharacterized protein n=1 Tax=Devosia nanyangense TaxID=1228055 RepID=A0A933L0K0_9HYPH|nr:hypothetical protein [Devosia nanyangense]
MTREDDTVKAAQRLFATIERGDGAARHVRQVEKMVQVWRHNRLKPN